MTFQIGDKVVYPNQGVGTIENISSRAFGTAYEKFYLLRFGSNSVTVMVPFSNAANIGLRRVTKDREISRSFVTLRRPMFAAFEKGTITVTLLDPKRSR